MRAIHIDAANQTVTEIDHSGKLKDMYATLGVELVECVALPDGVDMWIDEEGAINGTDYGFLVTWGRDFRRIAGRALLLSSDEEGDCVDLNPAVTVEEVRRRVRWLHASTADAE